MSTCPPCIADNDDSGLAITSSAIGILTFLFAIGATIRLRVNSVHEACSRFADFKTIVKSFENESKWMRDLLHRQREVPSVASPQPDRAPYIPAARPQSILDSFFDVDEPSDAEADGETRLRKVVDAVDDATSTAKTAIPTIRLGGAHPSSHTSEEKARMMRAHLLAEAQKRRAVNAVIEEFRRRRVERRKANSKPVYERLLEDPENGDDSLRAIVTLVEKHALSRTGTIRSFESRRSQRSADRPTNNGEQNGGTGAQTKPEYVADTHVGTWSWWLGFDADGKWTWRRKAKMSKQWLQSREYAMVLKEQRAALSSQVMFAQLAIVQSQIADRVLSDSADSQLIREVAKLRDELASQESAAERSRNNHMDEHIASGNEQ